MARGRLGVALAAAAAVLAAPASGAPAGNGRIVLSDAVTQFAGVDLFTVGPDGSDRRQLTFARAGDRSAKFSPDGSRVAWVRSGGGPGVTLYVANANGSGGERALADHPEAHHSGTGITYVAWSPDGTKIAYSLTGSGLYVVDSRDGTRLEGPRPGEPIPSFGLDWAPAAEMVYPAVGGLFARRLGAAPRRVLAVDATIGEPVWSPDATRIAFFQSGPAGTGTFVVDADGTGLHRVGATETNIMGTPHWSPDGSSVVFSGVVRTVPSDSRFGPAAVSGVWIARADGSRQTLVREHVSQPRWSPDGGRLLIRQAFSFASGYQVQRGGVWTTNVDGTCLTKVAEGFAWDWQPIPGGVPVPPSRCVDLVLTAKVPRLAGLRGTAYVLEVENKGNEPARAVRVELNADANVVGASGGRGSCAGAVCTLGILGAGDKATVTMLVQARSPGVLVSRAGVSSSGADSDPETNTAELRTRFSPCWILGTNGNDRLIGGPRGELMCGLGGNDRLEGRGGRDRLEGGYGADVLVGGPGRDYLLAEQGDDVVRSVDGARDVVDCARGADTAIVDRRDYVSRSCERVRRL